MDVNRIDALAAHELTSLHIQALNSLLESTQTYNINNVQVTLSEAAMTLWRGLSFSQGATKTGWRARCCALLGDAAFSKSP